MVSKNAHQFIILISLNITHTSLPSMLRTPIKTDHANQTTTAAWRRKKFIFPDHLKVCRETRGAAEKATEKKRKSGAKGVTPSPPTKRGRGGK